MILCVLTFSLKEHIVWKNLCGVLDNLCVDDNAIVNRCESDSIDRMWQAQFSITTLSQICVRASVRACMHACVRGVCFTDVKADPGLRVRVAAVLLFALTSCKIPVGRSLFVTVDVIGENPSPRKNNSSMKEVPRKYRRDMRRAQKLLRSLKRFWLIAGFHPSQRLRDTHVMKK